MKEIFSKSSKEMKALKDLFGENEIKKHLDSLRKIHKQTEEAWNNNLKRFKGKKIKYLLLAEAPPRTDNIAKVNYFYNEEWSGNENWFVRVCHSFDITPKKPCKKEALDKLAKGRFLLIDTLPFALNYSMPKNVRKKTERYNKLVSECLDFWTNKIHILQSRNLLEKDIKCALALKINGCATINALNKQFLDKIYLPFKINENSIAADGSGSPSPARLKEIFKLL